MTLGIVEMLLGGVTSFVDMYYHENRCVEVARRLGIRAMLGCNYFDNNVDGGAARGGEGRCAGCRLRPHRLPSHPIRLIPCRPKTCGAARS